MVQPQRPSPTQEEDNVEPSPSRRSRWIKVGLATGSVLVLAGTGVVLWGWRFANNGLSPWLSAQLSETFQRPVQIGEIERITLSGVRVGPSAMPPTEDDPDTLSLEAVEIRFNLLDLFQRELNLDIDLETASAYLEQTADGEWIALDIAQPDPDEPPREALIAIRPRVIRLSNADLTMVPYSEPPGPPPTVSLENVNGEVVLSRVEAEDAPGSEADLEAQQVDFDVAADSAEGGSLAVEGSVLLQPQPTAAETAQPPVGEAAEEDTAAEETAEETDPTRDVEAKVNIRAQDLNATEIMPVVGAFLEEDLPIDVLDGVLSGNVTVELNPDARPELFGTAQTRNAIVRVPGLPAPIEDLSGQVRFQEDILTFEDVVASLGGLSATAEGTIDLEEGYALEGQFAPFTVAEATEIFDVNLPIEAAGRFTAEVTMTGPLKDPVVTTALTAVDTATIDRIPFSTLSALVVYNARTLVLERIQAVPLAGGSLSAQGRYSFTDPGLLALQFSGTGLPADTLGRAYGLPEAITLGVVSVNGEISGPVDRLQGAISWRAPAGDYPSRGEVLIADNIIRFRDTFVQAAGGTLSGNGLIANGQWQADLQARGVQLQRLGANLAGAITGQAQLSGSLDNFSLQGIQGRAQAAVALAGGTLVGQGTLTNGQWQANVQTDGVRLSQVSPNLQGAAQGRFAFSGNVNNLSLAGIRGEGNFVLSEGLATAAALAPQLASVNDPLTGSVVWNGEVIQITQAQTNGIQVSGTVTPRLTGAGAPAIANLNLNLDVQNYALAALPFNSPVPLEGAASFTGRLTGTPANLNLIGDARLTNLVVSGVEFDPVLSGPVQFASATGVNVNLQGSRSQDVIQAAYSFGGRNLEFLIRADEAIAEGRTEGDIFTATVSNFPLTVLNLPPGGVGNIGTLAGTIETATITANLSQPTVSAQFEVVDPALGYISFRNFDGEDGTDPIPGRLRGTFYFADGTATLRGVELISERSQYLLTGSYNARRDPQLNLQISVERGDVQDLLTALQFFELSDLSRGLVPPDWVQRYTPEEIKAILATVPVGNPNAPLMYQLRRLAEILEFQDQQVAQAESAPLPPLDELEGSFSGGIQVVGSAPANFDVAFDLSGEDWAWGNAYTVDEVVAEGQYSDGVLRLNPVRLASNDVSPPAILNLNGELSLNPEDATTRTLSLNIANVPLDYLRQPLPIPPTIDGLLFANARLTGSLQNPLLRGVVDVEQMTINRNPIQEANAQFLYQEATLRLTSQLLVEDEEDPLRLLASIPYRPGFVTQSPPSEDLLVSLSVRNEGLQLLNLFTQAITWESGEGDIQAQLQGVWPDGAPLPDLQSLSLVGSAEFNDATVSGQALPNPITNLTGRAVFQDYIVVEGLSGNLNNGELFVQGSFPLFAELRQQFPVPTLASQPESTATDSPPGNTVEDQPPADPTPDDPTQPDLVEPDLVVAEPTCIPDMAANPGLSPADFPLTLDLRNVALDFKGIYDGNVDGCIQVGGSLLLLGPQIRGAVVLSRGQLSLPDTAQLSTANGASQRRDGDNFTLPAPAFDDLRLVLGNNIRIALAGLVDVTAVGDITLDGILPDVQPEGRISLPRGRVSLLATEFRLVGDNNYAEFRPSLGLEPYLNATLRTDVVTSTRGSSSFLNVASPFPRNEIPDTEADQLGLNQSSGVETIRIQAEVSGPATQVANLRGVTLSSTPTRSESEIVSLISQGYLAALESTLGSVGGEGDSFQGLLALGSTVLLNSVQDLLGDAFDLSDVRLYTVSPNSTQTGSSLDFGAEVGFELSPSISMSVQKIFTNVTPFQFNVRYRLSDQFVLRGTTSYEDFNDNTGLLLEYESRF